MRKEKRYSLPCGWRIEFRIAGSFPSFLPSTTGSCVVLHFPFMSFPKERNHKECIKLNSKMVIPPPSPNSFYAALHIKDMLSDVQAIQSVESRWMEQIFN